MALNSPWVSPSRPNRVATRPGWQALAVTPAPSAEGAGVTANACHPGLVATRFGLDGDTHGLFNAISRPFVQRIGLSPTQGAATQIWLASSPEVADRTGRYFVNAKEARPSHAARDDEAARVLWEVSEDLTA